MQWVSGTRVLLQRPANLPHGIVREAMAWIRIIDENEGGQPVVDAFAAVRGARGQIANILKIHSLRPDVLVAHLELYRKLMFGRSGLTRMERETIAVAVSVLNHCHY